MKSLGGFVYHWAEMPLSKEELATIPYSHRVRPYLCLVETDEGVIGFPCTSKFEKKVFYDNNILRRNKNITYLNKPTLIPYENFTGDRPEQRNNKLSNTERTEVIKKIYSIARFIPFPKELLDYLGEFELFLDVGDVIRSYGQYYIVSNTNDDYRCFRIYPYPHSGCYREETDGLCYYINYGESVVLKKGTPSTFICHLPIGNYDHYEENQINFKNFSELPVGSIITMGDKKVVIVRKEEGRTFILEGDGLSSYIDYEIKCIPNSNYRFTINGTLTQDRVMELSRRKLNK